MAIPIPFDLHFTLKIDETFSKFSSNPEANAS